MESVVGGGSGCSGEKEGGEAVVETGTAGSSLTGANNDAVVDFAILMPFAAAILRSSFSSRFRSFSLRFSTSSLGFKRTFCCISWYRALW